MSTIKTNNLQHTGSADVNLALDSSGYVAIQDGAAGTPALYFSGDSNTGIYSPGADSVAISTGGTARATVDSSGRFLVGTTSARSNIYYTTNATTPPIQAEVATNSYSAGMSLINYSASGYNPSLTLGASSSNTLGTNTALGGSYGLGAINFVGADGTNFRVGASIVAVNDQGGAWASGDCPARLVFSTTADGASSPTERMRIRENGKVWIGTTSDIRNNREQLVVKGTNVEGVLVQSNGLTYSGYVYRDADAGAGTHYIGYWENSSGTNVGAITHNNTNTTYATTSDYRLKENVEPIVGACDRLNQLKPCRFNFIADPDNTVDGFLAHEAQAVVPESVIGQKDAINEDGSVKPQGIDQSKLVPLLTAALQEAIGEIESLKARVAALESA